MKDFNSYIKYFEKHLNIQRFDNKPVELYEPIEYTLLLSGKRIRPVLTLMACELFDGDIENALPQAIAIELFHNFTLIHDDIMDNAPIRRGKKTVFKKWNSNIAILSGDTLFALAYQYVQLADKDILPEILSVFNKTAIEVCEGQQYDLNYEERTEVTVDEYIKMIRLKTAVLFGTSLKIGSLIGGATELDAKHLYDFGLNIGIGFQLKDDLLDTFGDETVFGKKTGGDILSNKKTFLYLHALEVASEQEKKLLISLYHQSNKDKDKVEKVKTIFDRLKINQAASKEIDKYFEKGIRCLEKVNAPKANKEKLLEVAHKMINREK
jgi:geranylgeranyl diphosphate synthase, type II